MEFRAELALIFVKLPVWAVYICRRALYALKEIIMKKEEKWMPHIIAVTAFVVFIVFVTACATIQPRDYSKEGDEAYKARNYPEAIKAYSRYLEKNKYGSINEHEFWNRGFAYLHEGYPERAKRDFERYLLSRQNWKPNAIPALRGSDPRPPIYRALYHTTVPTAAFKAWARGIAAQNDKNYDLAIEEYTEALNIVPDYPNAYLDRGQAYILNGRLDNAEADMNEVIRINEEYFIAVAYANLGSIYQQKRNYERAISYYDMSLRIEGYNQFALTRRQTVQHRLVLNNSTGKQNSYPAPFQGKWGFMKTVSGGNTVIIKDSIGVELDRYYVPSTSTFTIEYNFYGSNYSLIWDGKINYTGTFTYNGNTINLSNGESLSITSNGLKNKLGETFTWTSPDFGNWYVYDKTWGR